MKKNYKVEFEIDFKRNPHKGLYIALEGIDGAGKTVQAENLLQYFQKKGKDAMVVVEPRRSGIIGRVVNEVLQKRIKIPSVSLQYLINADRIADVHDMVLPALKKGTMLISHRCFWSSVPYGILDITGGKPDFKAGNTIIVAQSILSMYYQITVPDITFYLDIPSKTAIDRLEKMGMELEYYERLDKLENVRKAYKWMLNKFPDEFVVIDGEREPEEITKDLIKYIENYKK